MYTIEQIQQVCRSAEMEEGRVAYVAVVQFVVGDSDKDVVLLAHGDEGQLIRVREPLLVLGEIQLVQCDVMRCDATRTKRKTSTSKC